MIYKCFMLPLRTINNSEKISFLHVSGDTVKLCKEKFRKPPLHKKVTPYNDFLVYGCLFLSKAHADGSSDWLKYREHYNKCCRFREKDEYWLKGNKYYFDVDFTKHKIYVVDNLLDFINFIKDYGYIRFTQRGPVNFTNLLAYNIFNQFYCNLDGMYDWLISSPKIQNLIKRRDQRNLPLLKIFKSNVVIPCNIITNEFLADLIRTLKYYDKIVGNRNDLMKIFWIHLDTFDFYKMNKDGYKGIYYTNNFVKVNTSPCQKKNSGPEYDCNCIAGIGPKKEDIPDLIGLPNIMKKLGFGMTTEIGLKIKEQIEELIIDLPKSLGSDHLLVWDWIFD